MTNTETAILAAMIQWPRFFTQVVENLGQSGMMGEETGRLYWTLLELHSQGIQPSWANVLDLAGGDLSASFLASVQDQLLGVHASGAERWLLNNLGFLKRERAKKAGVAACMKEFESPTPDFDRIIEIAQGGKVADLHREDPDFETAWRELEDWKHRDRTGISLGFPTFDRLTDDFNYGEIIGIMGRTTVGKTWIGLHVVNHLVGRIGERIGLFSLEMSRAAVVERLGQIYFRLDRYELEKRLRAGTLHSRDFIDHFKPALSLYSRIYSVQEIERIAERDGLKVVVIDFLQLVRKVKGRGLYEEITHVIGEIKAAAKNLGAVIFVLIQLSRAAEGGWEPVRIDHARDSGAIEEYCDFLVGAWNPSLKEGAEPQWQGKLALRLLKNKRGPSQGIVVRFAPETGQLQEIAAPDDGVDRKPWGRDERGDRAN